MPISNSKKSLIMSVTGKRRMTTIKWLMMLTGKKMKRIDNGENFMKILQINNKVEW